MRVRLMLTVVGVLLTAAHQGSAQTAAELQCISDSYETRFVLLNVGLGVGTIPPYWDAKRAPAFGNIALANAGLGLAAHDLLRSQGKMPGAPSLTWMTPLIERLKTLADVYPPTAAMQKEFLGLQVQLTSRMNSLGDNGWYYTMGESAGRIHSLAGVANTAGLKAEAASVNFLQRIAPANMIPSVRQALNEMYAILTGPALSASNDRLSSLTLAAVTPSSCKTE